MSTANNDLNDEPRDEHIAEAYRRAVRADSSPAGPPDALDKAIRAAARRALHTGPESLASATNRAESIARRSFLRTWQTPLAAAATLALAIGVAIKVYDSGEADIAAEKPRANRSAAVAEPAPNSSGDINGRRLDESDAAQAQTRSNEELGQHASSPKVPKSESMSAPNSEPGAPGGPARSSTAREMASASPGLQSARRPGAVASPELRSAPAERADSAHARDDDRQQAFPGKVAPTAPANADRGIAGSRGSALPRREKDEALSKPSQERKELGRAVASTESPSAAPPAVAAATPSAQAQGGVGRALETPTARQRSVDKREPTQLHPAPSLGGTLNQQAERRALMEDRMAASSALGALIAKLATRPADAWFAEIRALKRAGRITDADALLAEFNKRFPTAVLPDDLR